MDDLGVPLFSDHPYALNNQVLFLHYSSPRGMSCTWTSTQFPRWPAFPMASPPMASWRWVEGNLFYPGRRERLGTFWMAFKLQTKRPEGHPKNLPSGNYLIWGRGIPKLGGGFKYFSFSPLPGEMIQFDEHVFQMGWFNHHLDGV